MKKTFVTILLLLLCQAAAQQSDQDILQECGDYLETCALDNKKLRDLVAIQEKELSAEKSILPWYVWTILGAAGGVVFYSKVK